MKGNAVFDLPKVQKAIKENECKHMQIIQMKGTCLLIGRELIRPSAGGMVFKGTNLITETFPVPENYCDYISSVKNKRMLLINVTSKGFIHILTN